MEDEPVPTLNQTRYVHLPYGVGVSEDLKQKASQISISNVVKLYSAIVETHKHILLQQNSKIKLGSNRESFLSTGEAKKVTYQAKC